MPLSVFPPSLQKGVREHQGHTGVLFSNLDMANIPAPYNYVGQIPVIRSQFNLKGGLEVWSSCVISKHLASLSQILPESHPFRVPFCTLHHKHDHTLTVPPQPPRRVLWLVLFSLSRSIGPPSSDLDEVKMNTVFNHTVYNKQWLIFFYHLNCTGRVGSLILLPPWWRVALSLHLQQSP